jgi:hypothetical protein
VHPLNNVRRPAKGNSLFSKSKKTAFHWSKKRQAFGKDGVAAFAALKVV